MWKHLLSCILSLCVLPLANCCTVQLEAEGGSTTGTQMYRSAASGGISVLLHKDDYVRYSFVTSSENVMSVQNVVYSNDGIGDQIRVSLNATHIVGSFTSRARTGNGGLWNVFLNSGPVGTETSISPGEHEITLEVASADEYGVELDRITLSFTGSEECPKFKVTSNNSVISPDNENSSSGGDEFSAEAIIGVTVTIAGVLIGVPSCILAIHGMYNCIVKQRPYQEESYQLA